VKRPLIVVEGSERAFADARRRVERAGLETVEAWGKEPGVVSVGTVSDAVDAAEALLSAVWGGGVVVHARAPREVTERLVEDLRRLGSVDYRPGETEPEPALTHEERALLELLATGITLGEAAEQLHLSRRTADRRLASARTKLGAHSTAETLVLFSRASGS
jgi:DNA-binding NarL/FixJ family response regulator